MARLSTKQTVIEPQPALFTPETLKFLRGLKRNNDRAWFEARRPVYESALRAPMLAMITKVNEAMAGFAPDHVKAPEKTVLRIYRDTRFSKNKQPYKQHYAAWWGRAGMVKTAGAGFYFHLSDTRLSIAAGLYMPDRDQLLAVRRYLLDHHEELRERLSARALKSPRGLTQKLEPMHADALTRAPKGFPADHPAIDLILNRSWGVETELPAEAALDLKFAATLAGYFKVAAPVVEFLNRPLVAEKQPRKGVFALPVY